MNDVERNRLIAEDDDSKQWLTLEEMLAASHDDESIKELIMNECLESKYSRKERNCDTRFRLFDRENNKTVLHSPSFDADVTCLFALDAADNKSEDGVDIFHPQWGICQSIVMGQTATVPSGQCIAYVLHLGVSVALLVRVPKLQASEAGSSNVASALLNSLNQQPPRIQD
jgi:hypothetical protein